MDAENIDALAGLADKKDRVELTHAERVRVFHWFRQHAIDALLMARQMCKIGAVVEVGLDGAEVVLVGFTLSFRFPLEGLGDAF